MLNVLHMEVLRELLPDTIYGLRLVTLCSRELMTQVESPRVLITAGAPGKTLVIHAVLES